VKELKKKNIDNVVSVSEQEIRKVYESNRKWQLAKTPYEKIKGKITAQLKAEQKALQRQKYLDQLKKNYGVSFSLPKPLPLTLNENPRQGPEKGPSEAAITVVMFTDFECPFCNKAHQRIMDLQARYPHDVRIVFRHFPLNRHRNAHVAAYAAACAHLQGKFWPYADLLFKNQRKLGRAKLFDYARQVGLDMKKFKQCMESGRGKEIVDADNAEGLELGIHSTPSVFFNGHFVKGVPKPKFIKLILDQYLPNPN
jgi:protein-disulfide isomerase